MTTPVIYRTFGGEVTAILPTIPANPGCFVCYAHIGQHGECSAEWYHGTKPATPDEYRDLHAELQDRYDGDLKIYKRLQWRAMVREPMQ